MGPRIDTIKDCDIGFIHLILLRRFHSLEKACELRLEVEADSILLLDE